jgi:hypothetical protein
LCASGVASVKPAGTLRPVSSDGAPTRRPPSKALKRINPGMLDVEYTRRALTPWMWDEDFIELRLDGLRKAPALVGEG